MLISEERFKEALNDKIGSNHFNAQAVTGPGRSGAIAAVYASYLLGIPFVPYGQIFPGRLLLIDTASQTGKTMRKAWRNLDKIASQGDSGMHVISVTVYKQEERLHFWYENQR